MKASEQSFLADARLRTDDGLKRERRLIGEIARERAPTISEATIRLDHARLQTDVRLAGERAEMEEALLDCSRDLLAERRARATADAALADRRRCSPHSDMT